jgi:hypothetical protein
MCECEEKREARGGKDQGILSGSTISGLAYAKPLAPSLVSSQFKLT